MKVIEIPSGKDRGKYFIYESTHDIKQNSLGGDIKVNERWREDGVRAGEVIVVSDGYIVPVLWTTEQGFRIPGQTIRWRDRYKPIYIYPDIYYARNNEVLHVLNRRSLCIMADVDTFRIECESSLLNNLKRMADELNPNEAQGQVVNTILGMLSLASGRPELILMPIKKLEPPEEKPKGYLQ